MTKHILYFRLRLKTTERRTARSSFPDLINDEIDWQDFVLARNVP
jgi:hypothetical protein